MDILREKDLKLDFSNDVLDIIELMDLTDNISLVGSMNLKSMIYANDYDCFEQIKVQNFDIVLTKWKLNISDILHKKDVYIGDIKCGVDKKKEPLRWKPKDVMNGYVLQNGQQFDIIDCMKSGEMWKIDVIALINNVFKEFSCVYDINTNKNEIQTKMTHSLRKDVQEKYKEHDYFKCLKRIFSISQMSKDDKATQYIYPYLVGDLGILSNLISDIGTIQYLIDNVQYIDEKKIKYEIDQFKSRLSNIYKTNAFLKQQKHIVDMINKIENEKYQLKDIGKLQNILQSILSNSGKTILNSAILRKYLKK
jgi:hypothetical protein